MNPPHSTHTDARSPITGIILAGGEGRRTGFRDKGLQVWRGQPLVAHVHARFASQVDALVISCNRNAGQYRQWSNATIPDRREGFQGPLAGLEACASEVRGAIVVVVTCDVPLLPSVLVERLVSQLASLPDNDIAYAHDGHRAHYLCAAMRQGCLASLTPFLDSGGRAVRHWFGQRTAVSVDFSDHADAFKNVNTPGTATP